MIFAELDNMLDPPGGMMTRNSPGSRLLIFLCLSMLAPLLPRAAGAQEGRGILTGFIKDAASNDPLTTVEVVLEGTGFLTTTGPDGRFVFRGVPVGIYSLRASRFGYEDLEERVEVSPDSAPALSLSMTPREFRLEELVVAPGHFSIMGTAPSTHAAMSRMEIESVPQFGEDIFRAVNRLPGLSSSDYAAHFSIRGGRYDETLILLDGLEIYEPYHLKDYNDGAISIIDAETIDGVELMTGGFPAQYGNRTSGVFSIRSRDPAPDESRYSIGLSLVNARGMAEGTFGRGKGSWLLSARRGYLDLILDLLKQIDLPSPTYYDVFGKTRYQLSPGHELSLNLLHARDKYTFDAAGTTGFNDSIKTRELANNRYGNSYVWANLRSLLGDRAEVNTTVSAGLVTTFRDGTEYFQADHHLIYALENTRDFNVLGFKQDWRWDWSRSLSLKAGVDLRRFDAKYAFTNLVNQDPNDPTPDTTGFYPHETNLELKRQGTTLGSYLSARVSPLEALAVEAGLRYDRSSYTGDRDLSPRFNALLRLSDATSLRAGWGFFRQVQPIADLEAFQGPETYFPSELSKQITVGLEQDLGGYGLLRVEGYLKRGSHLRPVFRTWKGGLDVFPETGEDWLLVHPDSSVSKGIEVYWRGRLRENLNVTASYSLASVDEWTSRIDNLNVPQPIPFDVEHGFPQDQRHAGNLDLAYRPSGEWTLNLAYAFHTGWPGTWESVHEVQLPDGTVDSTILPDKLYGSRLPSYQRIDLRVTKRIRKARGDLRFFFEVSNLTNHENVFGYDVYREPNKSGQIVLIRDAETGFPILPSFGISWTGSF